MDRLTYAEWGGGEYRDFLRVFSDESALRSVAMLEDRLAALYAPSRIFLVNRGRFGLEIALRVFAGLRPAAREVLYPGYICDSVIAAIKRCGLIPRPIDVTVDLNIDPSLVKAALSEQTLAVIAAHMYACPAEVDSLEKICRDRGVFLLDDAAQAGGVRAGKRLLGTYGDAGVLSFSQSKTLVAGGINAGGALVINNPALIDRVEMLWRELPPGHYSWSDRWQFLRDSIWEPYLGGLHYYWTQFRRRCFSTSVPELSCPATRIAPTSSAVVIHQLDRLDQRMAGRVRVARLYHEELSSVLNVLFPQYQPDRYLARILLMMPEKVSIPALRLALMQQGVQTRRSYQIHETPGAALPNASFASQHYLELPSHSHMSRDTVRSIVERLSKCLN